MNADDLAQVLETKRLEMVRIIGARLRYHGREMDAEDIIQDAMVNLLEYQPPIRPEELPGLFHATASRLAYNRIRDTKNHNGRHDEYTTVYQPDSQAHMRQREQLKVDVELALDKLPDERTRQVTRLVWMEGYNWTRTAKVLRCSKRDVQTSLETALPILQLELARYDHRVRPANVPAADRLGVSASQPSYKEESDETDSYTAPWAAMGRDEVAETVAA